MVLMSGSVLAQAIPIVLMPALTRLFTPGDLGVLAVFTSVCAIAAVVATGRYEQATLIPKEEKEATSVTGVAITLALGVSLAIALPLSLFPRELAERVGHPEFAEWLLFFPVALFFVCCQQSLTVLSQRRKQFQTIATVMIVYQVVYQAGSLAAGFAGFGFQGLIVSFIVANLVMGLAYLKRGVTPWPVSADDMRAAAVRFKRFPQVLVFAHLLNAASLNFAPILFSSYFGLAAAGFFALAQRACRTPIGLVGQSYGQVFRQQVSEQLDGDCRPAFLHALKRLSLISFGPFVLLFFFAPKLFGFVFGEEWTEAGEYVRVMTPMFFLQFVATPVSYFVVLRERQGLDLAWQSALFGGTVAVFVVGQKLELAPTSTLGLFAGLYCVMYLVLLYMNWICARPAHA